MGTNHKPKEERNFIEDIIAEDLDSGKYQKIVTRFPPEPNGYLHIGHAKAFCLNFGLALENPGSRCHLRFDDTNPEKEDQEYVDAIKEDVQWFGFDWGNHLYYASDYFEQLYAWAQELIRKNLAYVDDQSAEEIRLNRGDLKNPGKASPFRSRTVEENLALFAGMREGKFADGDKVLRAKIDMNHANMNMRDPVLYRIRRVHHVRTGDKWCIYPMYDYAHALSDSQEHITHSLCTLEFQDHRVLYDWCVANVTSPSVPRQIEFARFGLNFTIMSKRSLIQLVKEKVVSGWDDPRMPTIRGIRRRGYTAQGIKNFFKYLSVGKKDTIIEMDLLEEFVRNDLNEVANRALCVVNPLKVVITNWPKGEQMILKVPQHPQYPERGERDLVLGGEIYIEQEDFLENPPKKFFRLGPGKSVRLRYGPILTCHEVIKDTKGEITQLRCEYHPDSFHGVTPESLGKVKGIIHWVDAQTAVDLEIRQFDRLFTVAEPARQEGKSFLDFINPNSVSTKKGKGEASLANCKPEDRFQFERLGYYVADQVDYGSKKVFNLITNLKSNPSSL